MGGPHVSLPAGNFNATLAKIVDRAIQFIIPAKKDLRPKVLCKHATNE
jgi:hypothetical protein